MKIASQDHTSSIRAVLVLLFAFLSFGVIKSEASIFIKLIPVSPLIGGEVVLNVSYNGPNKNVNWYKAPGNAVIQSNLILAYSPKFQHTDHESKYTGRETIINSASLKITNLLASDIGDYTIVITSPPILVQETVHLMVYDLQLEAGIQEAATLADSAKEEFHDLSPDLRDTNGLTAENRTPTWVIVTVVALAVKVAVLTIRLYRRYGTREGDSRTQLIPPSPRDLAVPDDRTGVRSHGYIGPCEI